MFSPEKKKTCVGLNSVYNHPIFDETSKDRNSLCSVASSDETRSNEHKLKYKKFHLNVEKTCFSVSIVKHCNREIAQRACGVSIVEVVKIQQDTILSNSVYMTWSEQGFELWGPQNSLLQCFSPSTPRSKAEHRIAGCLIWPSWTWHTIRGDCSPHPRS